MNTVWAILLLVGGLVILWKCAGLLVTGAVGLAQMFGVSPLVIGLTVVAMGTSAPEVAASIAAVIRGTGDVAIGNVYGSNIANLALVGGLCALIRPMKVQLQTLRHEIPVMIATGLLLLPVLHNLYLSRPEGISLLVLFTALILLTVYSARRGRRNIDTHEQKKIGIAKALLFAAVGLAGLALGADMAVRGAVFLGERIGLSQAVIGLTIIAIGTSLPELATSLAAVIKEQHDISIGNLVGSNIFNTLLVVGTAGTVKPFTIGQRLVGVDYWVMILVSATFALIVIIGRRVIGRAGGIFLLCMYIGYIIYLLGYTAGA